MKTASASVPRAAPGTAPLPRDSVEIATRHFYWKPVYAFLRVFELEAFAAAGMAFPEPVLDLGSGSGTFARMLRERGVLDNVAVALDSSAARLAGSEGVARWGPVRADSRSLPFRQGAFGAIVSNAVICCIPTDRPADIEAVLEEAHRVLRDGGVLAFSVATVWYNRNLPLPRVYRRLGAAALARRYLRRLDRGLEHYQVWEERRWLDTVRAAGFRVERVEHYFTPRQAAWWNLFTLQAFRVFALAKLSGMTWMRRLAAGTQAALFRPLLARERGVPDEDRGVRAGYIMIVARKRDRPAPPPAPGLRP